MNRRDPEARQPCLLQRRREVRPESLLEAGEATPPNAASFDMLVGPDFRPGLHHSQLVTASLLLPQVVGPL